MSRPSSRTVVLAAAWLCGACAGQEDEEDSGSAISGSGLAGSSGSGPTGTSGVSAPASSSSSTTTFGTTQPSMTVTTSTTFGPPPRGGDCCANHPGIGCDDPQIEACVCGERAECCEVAPWGANCVRIAEESCGLGCAGMEGPGTTADGTGADGTAGGSGP